MASRPPTEADFAAFRQSLKQRRIRGYDEAMAETKARFPDRNDRFRYIDWAAAQSRPSHPPTEADFAAFSNSLEQRDVLDCMELTQEIDSRFPDQNDSLRYTEWAVAQSAPGMIRDIERRYECPSTAEFIDCVKRTPYNTLPNYSQLIGYLEGALVPLVIVGRDEGYVYRIAPAAYLLEAHGQVELMNRRMVAPECMLGVNFDVEPSLRKFNVEPSVRKLDLEASLGILRGRTKHTNLPEQSTKSTESDDVSLASGTASGFVFHQLGDLEVLSRENWQGITGEQQAYEAPWVPTGFCVVVRINPDGSAGEIWVMYNFFPFDAEDERYHVYTEDWGYLPSDDPERCNQFSCAKITDSIDDLGAGYRIRWEEKVRHEPELVRVVRSGDSLVRQNGAEHRSGSWRMEGSESHKL